MSEYQPGAAGEISAAALDRLLPVMWHREHERPRLAGWRDLVEGIDGEARLPPDPFCPATLFRLPDPLAWLRADLIETGTPVHPRDAAYLDPVQGPAPLRCALEPHPEGTWHWDGNGTWFR